MCPFIDKAHAQCAGHLNLKNLSHAFAHCADHYTACSIYRKLLAKERNHDRVKSASRFLVAS